MARWSSRWPAPFPLRSPVPRPSSLIPPRAAALVLLLVSAGAAGSAAAAADPSGVAATAAEPSRPCAVPALPEVDDDSLALWIERILPRAAEMEWTRIPWIPNLGDGVATAEAEGKPILLWLMNGHPCGCT